MAYAYGVTTSAMHSYCLNRKRRKILLENPLVKINLVRNIRYFPFNVVVHSLFHFTPSGRIKIVEF